MTAWASRLFLTGSAEVEITPAYQANILNQIKIISLISSLAPVVNLMMTGSFIWLGVAMVFSLGIILFSRLWLRRVDSYLTSHSGEMMGRSHESRITITMIAIMLIAVGVAISPLFFRIISTL